MIRHKSFINFICAISIASTLLVSLTGKVIPVKALALPSDSFTPIYDTQIIDISNYLPEIEASGGDPIIFFILCGLSVISYAGFAQYKLELPYEDPSDALEWISNVGVRLYNTVASLSHTASITLIDPLLDYIHGAYEEYNRLTALNVNDINTFIDYYNAHPDYSFKVDKNLLPSVNQIMALNQKLYDWQFSDRTFGTGFIWDHYTLNTSAQTLFNSYFAQYSYPTFVNYINPFSLKNFVIDFDFNTWLDTYHNFFIDTDNHMIYVCDDNGNYDTTTRYYHYIYAQSVSSVRTWNYNNSELRLYSSYNSNLTVVEIINGILDYTVGPFAEYGGGYSPITIPFHSYGNKPYKFFYGLDWNSRVQVFPNEGLNFEDNPSTYVSTPYMDTFIKIKDIIEDISMGTDNLYNVVFDNIYDIDTGVNLIANDLYNISVAVQDLVDNIAPPIPVNLNDIAIYTENDYLNEIKERSTKFGETLGEYFVFWHNSDPMTVYVIFGSVIVILIGAFIGKWGHS